MNYGSDGLRRQFLSECCRNNIHVVIYTMNGFQLKGFILGFDESVLVVRQSDGKQSMIYRHAISTIVPDCSIEIA